MSKLLIEEEMVLWPIQKFKSLILLQKKDYGKAYSTTQHTFSGVSVDAVTKLLNILIPVPVADREQMRTMCPYCFAPASKNKHINAHMTRHENHWTTPDAWLKDYGKRTTSNIKTLPYVKQYVTVMSILTKAANKGPKEPHQVAQRLSEAVDRLAAIYAPHEESSSSFSVFPLEVATF